MKILKGDKMETIAKSELGEVLKEKRFHKTCGCIGRKINCMTGKEWVKSQLGVWRFGYQTNDVRDKKIHPATYPIDLVKKCISLFSHKGELILDPFSGVGTTSVAAKELNRNSIGVDLNANYTDYAKERIKNIDGGGDHYFITDNAKNISEYLPKKSVKFIVTSPPYSNLLNRKRKNKSRRGLARLNSQYNKVEQYSQNPEDLGTMPYDVFSDEIQLIFENLKGILRDDGHVIINVPDFWLDNKRITLHISVIEALRKAGYEFRNTIIWDRTNIVNGIGIFGYPSNYITMGTTFEYLLHFIKAQEGED